MQEVPLGQFTSIKNVSDILGDFRGAPIGRALGKSPTSPIPHFTNLQSDKAPPGIPTHRALKSEREFFTAKRPENDLPLLAAEGIHSVRVGKQDRFFGTAWNGFTNLPTRLSYRNWSIPVPWTFPPVIGPISAITVPAPIPAAAVSTAVSTAVTPAVTAAASASVAAASVPASGPVDHGSSTPSAAGPGSVSIDIAAATNAPLFGPRRCLDDDSEDSDSCDEMYPLPKAPVAGPSGAQAGKRKRQAEDTQIASRPSIKNHKAA
jgi:hypothetical protein